MNRIARRLAVLLFALCFAWPVIAQNVQVEHLLLRRVTCGDSIVYLLGSVHVAKPDIYPLNDYVENAFSQSVRLVVETDIRVLDQAALQRKIFSLGVLPAGRTLRGELGTTDAERLEAKLSELGLSAASLDRFRPWVIYTLLAALDMARLGYDSKNGVDLHFLQRVGDRKIIELETADFQVELLAGFTDQEQSALLVEYLDERGKLEKEIGALFDAWLVGDDARMAEILEAEMSGTPADQRVKELVLRKRNAAMAEKIEGLLKLPGTSFVVVGAAHLGGEGSVVDILKRDGYEMTTVRE